MRVLLTNDDGIGEPGLAAVERWFDDHETVVVAPSGHRSGAGQSLTLYEPLDAEMVAEGRWAVSGTPADCVKLALLELLDGRLPDLVVSGINPGPNLGNNICYSGTVGAAAEAALWDLPSIAVSVSETCPRSEGCLDIAAGVLGDVLAMGIHERLPRGSFLNLNIPILDRGTPSAIVWTRAARFPRDLPFDAAEDGPDGGGMRFVYRRAGSNLPESAPEGTDVRAYISGLVSLTLLDTDRTGGRGVSGGSPLALSG